MSIDKLLKEAKESDRFNQIPENISEKCWKNIKRDIKIKQKWYDKFFIKIHNANKKFHLKAAFQLAFLIIFIASIPLVFKETKFYISNSDFLNTFIQRFSNDNVKDDKTKDTVLDERPEYKETDKNYLKALETVKVMADKRYSNYTLYSTGELFKEEKDNYYNIEIYENASAGKLPGEQDIIRVDSKTFALKSEEKTIDDYFSKKTNQYVNNIYDDSMCLLINKADNLNIGSNDKVYSSINLYVNVKSQLKKVNSKIPDDAYYYKEQPDIYYLYDKNDHGLYKCNTLNNDKKLIYKYNPNEYSILTIENKVDIDGDGKVEDIKFDPLRNILSVNNISIYVPEGIDFKDFKIVDIYNKDKEKEIYISSEMPGVTGTHSIYVYKNSKIAKIISGYGTPVIDGSGKVVFQNTLSQFFQTHFTDFEYQYYKDSSLRLITKDLYTAKKSDEASVNNSYQIIKPKKQLNIYKNKNSNEVAAVLKAGEKVQLLGYDEHSWVLVENSQGVKGWFEVNGITIKQLDLFSGDAFDGLNFAS